MKRLLFLLLMASLTDASLIEYTIDNFNTLQPVVGANVTLYNSTYSTSQTTDDAGIVYFTINDPAVYSVLAARSGYTSQTVSLNVSNSSVDYIEQIYLYPNSNQGIIRLTLSDLTLSDHKVCFYFDNDRLENCYFTNETVTIHNNMAYKMVVILETSDMLTNASLLKKYGSMYFMIFIGLIMVFSLLIAIYYMGKRAGKR